MLSEVADTTIGSVENKSPFTTNFSKLDSLKKFFLNPNLKLTHIAFITMDKQNENVRRISIMPNALQFAKTVTDTQQPIQPTCRVARFPRRGDQRSKIIRQ